MKTAAQAVLSLLKSTHPVPSVAVALFAALFGVGFGLPAERVLVVGLSVLAQQFSVGLSNDWLDSARDRAVARTDKPVAIGSISIATVRNFSFFFAAVSVALASLLGPESAALMIPMLIIGWAYNLGLKANAASFLPYVLGFGVLPVFVTLSAASPELPPIWVVSVAALLGVSAHFANVLPDIIEDRETGVRALPHLLGQRISAIIISITAITAAAVTVTQSNQLQAWIAITGFTATAALAVSASLLSLRPKPPRIVFPLLMIASLVNVVLLMLG